MEKTHFMLCRYEHRHWMLICRKLLLYGGGT